MSEMEHPASPFDAIRRIDGYGEYWTGRELMPVMGYGADWRNFADAIERGKAACANAGHDPADHIGETTKKVPIGSGATRSVADYRLTRFGAYLVAMNGDPRKKEIALAQTYFTVKTRQAEVAQEPLDELELAERNVQLIKEKRAALARARMAEEQLAIAAPKADAWQALASAEGDFSVRQAAYILNRDPNIRTGQNRLFKRMRELKIVDRNDIPYQAHDRHVVLRPRDFTNPYGTKKSEDQLRVTIDGLRYLHKKLGGKTPLSELFVHSMADAPAALTAEPHAVEATLFDVEAA